MYVFMCLFTLTDYWSIFKTNAPEYFISLIAVISRQTIIWMLPKVCNNLYYYHDWFHSHKWLYIWNFVISQIIIYALVHELSPTIKNKKWQRNSWLGFIRNINSTAKFNFIHDLLVHSKYNWICESDSISYIYILWHT